MPLPLLVSGHAKFELHVGTIDALVADPSAPVSAEEAMWTIAGGTVPEGNVDETEGDGKGKGKAKSKPKKEEPKAKGKGKGKKKGKDAPVETKEPTPEKKKPKVLKPAQAVWPSPAFSFFMAEETLDSLLNMSLTQSTLELPLSVVRVSSGHDGSTVPEVLDGTLDIAAMCEVGVSRVWFGWFD